MWAAVRASTRGSPPQWGMLSWQGNTMRFAHAGRTSSSLGSMFSTWRAYSPRLCPVKTPAGERTLHAASSVRRNFHPAKGVCSLASMSGDRHRLQTGLPQNTADLAPTYLSTGAGKPLLRCERHESTSGTPDEMVRGMDLTMENLQLHEDYDSMNSLTTVKPAVYVQYMEINLMPDPFKQQNLLFFHFQRKESTKLDLATDCGLFLRDLRSITKPDSNSRQIATIIIKPRAIVVHMGPLQAIIQKDRVLCFNLNHPLMQSLVQHWVVKLNKTSPDNPYFELKVMESLLVELVRYLEYSYYNVLPSISNTLESLLQTQTTEQLQDLLDAQIRLADFQEGVQQIQRAITEFLNSDEDMAAAYLSASPPRNPQEHDEVEMLLEAFMHAVTELDNRIKSMKHRISTTEEYIKIHFDGQRNRLIRTQLVFSLATFAVAIPSLGASIFGMNLTNHMEDHPSMFAAVCTGLFGVSAFTFLSTFLYYLSTKNTSLNRLTGIDAVVKSRSWRDLLAGPTWYTEREEASAVTPPATEVNQTMFEGAGITEKDKEIMVKHLAFQKLKKEVSVSHLYNYEKPSTIDSAFTNKLNENMLRVSRQYLMYNNHQRNLVNSVPPAAVNTEEKVL